MSPPASDTYSVTEALAHGGGAVMYRGVRNADGLPVLLKVLEGPDRTQSLKQLEHEYEIGTLFESSAIVRPLALQMSDGTPALVTEDFGGTSLEQRLGAPMHVEQFLGLATRITAAVAEIQRKDVVHRDLRPANVLVGSQGEVKITNLALASRLPRGRSLLQSLSGIEHALPYLSPEQTGRMNRSVDGRADLYALGVTFYQMLTGQFPFQATDPLEWVHCHVARTPRPLRAIVPQIPAVLSDIVLKLLAKLPEDRYQTARGLEHDLERCLDAWRAHGDLDPFPLGEHDVSDRFEISEKLYGRQEEISALVSSFERVCRVGRPELVAVSGYSGIGKSSLVRELHRPIARARGLFVAGKFDQYSPDVPYSAFAQAFAELVDEILTQSEDQLARRGAELTCALGTNGQLIIDIIPRLELIIGPQPSTLPLAPLETQNRFQRVFRDFVGFFARKEHPLALFLDDLQWIDSGSLRLLEDLIAHLPPEGGHLLVLGAYRENEVGPSHPLTVALDRMRKTGGAVHEIVLRPLGVEHLRQLVADTLHCSAKDALPLASVVHQKTGGNPFFSIQFLTTLYQEGLLEFDRASSEWRANIAAIRAKGYTDNVLDLMLRKWSRLSAPTREVLILAACIGTRASLHTLATISEQTEEETARQLAEAVSEGFVTQAGDRYAFVHDRIQQAVHAFGAARDLRAVHLEIGRLLLRSIEPRTLEEHIFDIVTQLNRGIELMTDAAEKNELARLDLIAGRKAKAFIAYGPARDFLATAQALLPEDAWESQYDLAFEIVTEHAECEYLCGRFEQAEALFDSLLTRARDTIDKAACYERRIKLCQVEGKFDEAVELGVLALRLFGIQMPGDLGAIAEAMFVEAQQVRIRLADRRIADLANVPEATDDSGRALIGLLANLATAAYITGRPLLPVAVIKLVNFSLEYGPTPESCIGYSGYGILLATLFDDPRAGDEFSKMSIDLSEKLGDVRRRGTVLAIHGSLLNHWVHPFATSFPFLEEGLSACIAAGDLLFAGFIAAVYPWQALERGDSIHDIFVLSEKYGAFARESHNDPVHLVCRVEQQFAACLMGRTRNRTSFDDDSFDEERSRATLEGARFGNGVICYHMLKTIAAYLAGDDELALHHASETKTLLQVPTGFSVEATVHYFDALLLARIHPTKDEKGRSANLAALADHERKLAFWASMCPENFLTKHALVSAEIARIAGDELRAERLYEDAIRAARANGFVHWQAIANELAARFHRVRGFETIANAYVRDAVDCYTRWGADAKVRDIETETGLGELGLRAMSSERGTGTFAVRTEHLDLLSVIKASQTISSEIMEEQLLRTLLNVVLEEGGAQRALLLFPHDASFTIAGEASVSPESSSNEHAQELESRVPLSVIKYAQRTKEPIVLDGTQIARRFARDPHFVRIRPQSALCLPIRRQSEVIALLYLENELVPGAFTPERLLVLDVLASQAAISLQNALLLEREHTHRVEAEVAGERALLLGEATSVMSSSFDYEGVFPALARLCVRSFADWAVLELVENGESVRLASAHRERAKEALLHELSERYPTRLPGTSSERGGVLGDGGPNHLPIITDEQICMSSVNERHAALLRELGTRSAIIVPLVARDERLGTLTLVAASPNRFTSPDVDVAAELGRRAALAVDNARLLRETEHALHVREEFLSVASHELRTPLTPLRLVAECLTRSTTVGTVPSLQTLNGLSRTSMRAVRRLERLSRELLEATVLERGELLLERDAVDLVAVVRDAVRCLEFELRSTGCDIYVTGAESVIGVWDRARLEEVVTSLLLNAIKFGAGRPVEIRVSELDDIAELTVEDHGIGSEESRLAQVFGRFERAVSARHYGGLGLGLYIANRIVRAHGGTIHVDSKPGVGSKFTIELPCGRAEAAARIT